MAGPIEFYFDFSSAYSAIARLQIADIAQRHGRELRWQAISLGVIFRELRHALPFLHAMFEGSFSEGRNLSTPDAVAGLARELGIDGEAVLSGMAEPDIKSRLQAATSDAVIAGVFGAPTMIADGEMFWGADRLPYLDRWLQIGDEAPAGHGATSEESPK